MKTLFVIHGTYGNPNENWFPWLKNKLISKNIKVIIPKFPTPRGQTLDNWMKVFSKYSDYVDGNTVLVGHSTGAAFILNLLEVVNKKIDSAFLVSGYTGNIKSINEEDKKTLQLNEDITGRDFNWSKIRANCSKFYIIHSDNDPHIPLKKAYELSKNLNTKALILHNGGHFNSDAGYNEFPFLLDLILQK